MRRDHILIAVIVIASIALCGITYKRNSRWQTNTMLWEDVVSKSSQKARDRYTLGRAYYLQGSTDAAIEQYVIAIKLKPDYAEAYLGLGVAFQKLGLPTEAEGYYNRSLILQPNSYDAHMNLGNCYESRGLTDKAIEQYETALKLAPRYPLAHYNIAIAYEKKGMINEAIQHYMTAIETDPAFVEAKERLNKIYPFH